MKKQNLHSVILAVLFLGFLISNFTMVFSQADSKTISSTVMIPKSLKVTGYILLVDEYGSRWYNNRLFLYDSANNTVSRIMCRFEKQAMTENSPGLYSDIIKPAVPITGTLDIDINNPESSHANPAYYPVSASYSLGDLLRITGPVSGAHIPLATTPRLVISWSGGNIDNRFIVHIHELKGDTISTKVYDQRNVASRSLNISTRIFRAGMRYRITVLNTTGRFTLTGRTIIGSEIQFQQSTSTYFITE